MRNENLQRDIFESLGSGRRRAFSLQMAPMIDLIFLLLIFFLVAAKWRPEENFLPLQLSTAEAQTVEVGKVEPLVVHIRAVRNGCDVQIGRERVARIQDDNLETGMIALMEETRQCLLEQKRFAADPIEIVCDEAVKWDHLAKIYNVFFGAGLTDITFRMTE